MPQKLEALQAMAPDFAVISGRAVETNPFSLLLGHTEWLDARDPLLWHDPPLLVINLAGI